MMESVNIKLLNAKLQIGFHINADRQMALKKKTLPLLSTHFRNTAGCKPV